MERLILFLSVSLLLAGCTSTTGDQGEEPPRSQLPVGENAWGEQVGINISSGVSPSTVTVAGEEMVVWNNQNSFPATVNIEGVDRTFTVPANGSFAFKPSSSFSYTVSGDGGVVGSGEVVVE